MNDFLTLRNENLEMEALLLSAIKLMIWQVEIWMGSDLTFERRFEGESTNLDKSAKKPKSDSSTSV